MTSGLRCGGLVLDPMCHELPDSAIARDWCIRSEDGRTLVDKVFVLPPRWALFLKQAVDGEDGVGNDVEGALADEVGVGLDGALRPRRFDGDAEVPRLRRFTT